MEKEKVFTLSQVAEHNSKQSCWFVINGKVLDVTKFLDEHPGEEEVLIEFAGKDASKAFEDIGHSKAAKNLLLKFTVGHLHGYSMQEAAEADRSSDDLHKETKAKEMKAFVIKDEPRPRYVACIELFAPLMLAALYLGYRYMTGAIQLSS